MELFDVIRARKSIRAYQSREVEPEKLDQILRAVNAAPSAINLQSYGIVVVKDRETRERLGKACHDQAYVAQAPVVLVFLTDPRGLQERLGDEGGALIAVQDATIACTFAMLAATDLGLGTVWIGASDPNQVRAIVGAEPPMTPVAVLPIGYAAETPERTTRKPLSEIAHNERWQLS